MPGEQGILPPDPNRINDPKHWQERAEQAFAIAEKMGDPEARAAMLNVAEQYERLAKWAEERFGAPD
jgi:hypothetical protein